MSKIIDDENGIGFNFEYKDNIPYLNNVARANISSSEENFSITASSV